MSKRAVSVFMVICLIFSGCANKQSNPPCEYTKMKECDIGEIIWDEGQEYYIDKIMKTHCVKIKNQKVETSEYLIKLDEYFYNGNIGVAAYKFIISDLEGSPLTEEQYNKLVKLRDNGELDLMNERSSTPFANILRLDEGDQVVWYMGFLLSAVSPEDKVSEITQKDCLNCVQLYVKNDMAGEIFLPDYTYEEGAAEFNISGSREVIFAKMTEAGLCIIWNIERILTEFRKMISELPEGEDPEGYNYAVYENIVLHMKDGTEYDLLDTCCDMEIREENNIASFSAIWKDAVSLEEADSLEIDGMRFDMNR